MHPAIVARRRRLWALLSEGGPWTWDRLARFLGVSRTTVIRDVAYLEGAGYVERRGTAAIRVLIPLKTLGEMS